MMKTKKRIVLITTTISIALGLTGCQKIKLSPDEVKAPSELTDTVIGKDAMIQIGSGLYYDSFTRIVYWWNGYLAESKWATTPTPYYAPNGLPYRYNLETNTFEEIINE